MKELQLLRCLAKQEETLRPEHNAHLEINTIHYSSWCHALNQELLEEFIHLLEQVYGTVHMGSELKESR